jgi:hypothetical protein
MKSVKNELFGFVLIFLMSDRTIQQK